MREISARTLLLLSVLPVAVTGGQAYGEEKAKPVHAFIFSGQSNMSRMNPDVGFLPEAKRLFVDGEVVYVKAAKGGSPIRRWVKEWPEMAEKHGLHEDAEKAREQLKKRGMKRYTAVLEEFGRLVQQHPKLASVTLCWMQGESDAIAGCDAPYEEAFKLLVERLRRDLKQPEMYVVIGRLCDFTREMDNPAWQNLRKLQVRMAQEDSRMAWVDCDDLNDVVKDGKKHDELHYTRDGYKLLGVRFAKQAKALVDGKKPAADGRP